MELTLFNGRDRHRDGVQVGPRTGDPSRFRSYADFQTAFERQLEWLIDQAVDLNEKLAAWEQFYNYDRPHGAFNGKTPYEALRSLLASA